MKKYIIEDKLGHKHTVMLDDVEFKETSHGMLVDCRVGLSVVGRFLDPVAVQLADTSGKVTL